MRSVPSSVWSPTVDGTGTQRRVERFRARRRHEGAQDLSAVEADLDPNEIVSHSQPPP